MARRRSAWRTRLIADGVRAPVQPRGVLAKFEDLYSANADRQAAGKGPTGATVDGIRVPRMRADAISWQATPDPVRHKGPTAVRRPASIILTPTRFGCHIGGSRERHRRRRNRSRIRREARGCRDQDNRPTARATVSYTHLRAHETRH